MKNDREKAPGPAETGAGTSMPGVARASVLFSGVILILVFFGYRVQSRDMYSGLLITEFVLILLPVLLFSVISGIRPGEALRLNAFRPVNVPIVIGIMLFALPLATLSNLLNLLLVNSVFGRIMVVPLPSAKNGTQLLVNILVIAGSAGICEEVLFRGYIQRAFERFGAARSILLTAFLFSLFHLDFQKIFGTFMLGALIGYIVYRTSSLYCGMLAHFTNNAVAVVISYISEWMLRVSKPPDMTVPAPQNINAIFDMFAAMPAEQLIFTIMVYGFMLIFAAIVVILLVYSLAKVNPAAAKSEPHISALSDGISPGGSAKRLLWLLPGLFIILLWFYVQANGFLGIQNAVTETFRLLIGAAA